MLYHAANHYLSNYLMRLRPLQYFLFLFICFPVMSVMAETNTKPPSLTSKSLQIDASAAGFTSYVLPNGFKIILAKYPSSPNVKVELVVKTGSLLEGYGETGMAHLLEHMLFKGAGSRNSIKNDLTRIGAKWNADTTADRTSFFEVISAEPAILDEAIRIEADRFIRTRFTKEDLASEMTVVRNELEQNDSSPQSVLMRATLRQSFFWHGYGRPTIGARSDIEDAPFAVLQAFHKRYYRPDNAFIIISGNFDQKRVLALTSKLFSQAPKVTAEKISTWTREPAQANTNRSEIFLPAGMTAAMSAWKIPGSFNRQAIALSLASSAICSADWGSLRKQLVIEQKAANSASCFGYDKPQAGLLIGTASGGKNDDAEKLSRNLRENIEAAAIKGITTEQLERSRQEEINAFIRVGNAHEIFAKLLSDAEVAGDWRLAFWQHDIAKEITLEEANNALRKWIVPTNRSDILLRHADTLVAPEIPKMEDVLSKVSGKNWPSVVSLSDPLPQSASDLARATTMIPMGKFGQAALISRKTQGDLAWLVLSNDFGNEETLHGKTLACNIANSLVAFGGGGMDRDQLDAKLEALQANWNLSMGMIAINAPRKNIAAALDILLAAWSEPAMPVAEFDRIKASAISGIESALKDPSALASSVRELRFDNYSEGHPRKSHSLERELADMRALTFDQVQACQTGMSGLGHVRLAVVGDFTVQDINGLTSMIEKLPVSLVPFKRIPEARAPEHVDVSPIIIARAGNPNASISGMALLPITDEDEDFPALRIAVNILGGNTSSRIWNSLRETEGLAYSASAQLVGSAFEPRSIFMISATASSNRAETALSTLKKVLETALKDGFTEQEVAEAKKTWLQDRKRYTNEERLFAARLSQVMHNNRDFSWIARYDDRIATVTAKTASEALQKYIRSANLVWMIGKGTE